MSGRKKQDIVDNENGYTMKDMLNYEISNPDIENLDISTGYFNVQGYAMIKDSLNQAFQRDNFKMRLLLGTQAIINESTFEDKVQTLSLKNELDEIDLSLDSLSDVSSLITTLKEKNIQVKLGNSKFNHSKCYITDDSAYIGSSNFTKAGLTGNYELNAGLYQPGVTEKTREWFNRMWEKHSEDYREELIKVLETSKFGKPEEPYNIYIKIIFEKYKDILTLEKEEPKHDIKLTTFQKDAVQTALFILSEYNGAMIADATGLGKTNMGMQILKQKTLENKKILLIAPSQVLKSMWESKLEEAGLHVKKTTTTELLGRKDAEDKLHEYKNIDFILVDESQYFRRNDAKRSETLAKIMTVGNKRKQILLLSATPINNTIMDLYYQVRLITKGDDAYFWNSVGIPNLYKHMRDASNKDLSAGIEKIQRLLDTIMVRRTRSYIKEVYPKDTLNDGQPIKFPNHEYSPIRYNLAELYGNVFQKIVNDMDELTMAPYGIEDYNDNATEDEKKRHRIVARLQVITLLKRFESSIEAFNVSLNNKIKLYEHIDTISKKGKMIKVSELRKILSKGNRKDSTEEEFDMDEFLLEEIEKIETEELGKQYNMKKFRGDLDKDLKILNGIKKEMSSVTVDKKLESLRNVILKDKAFEKESKKILIFSEYTTTAKYLLEKIRELFPDKIVECITGNTDDKLRKKYIKRFAPDSNLIDEILQEKEIDVLISTEVLAEGQNLQDCNYVINYDLPWNPMRIVQRIGRVDRLTSKYDVIHSRACYPDRELDEILKLMGNILNKIKFVNKIIGLDAELLGETPTPQQYNGHLKDRLKTLGEGGNDASILIEKLERSSDLLPENTPLNEIRKKANYIGFKQLESMSMGRRSGKKGSKNKCVLAYLIEKPRRVFFVIYENGKAFVPDNDYDAINEIRCVENEPQSPIMDNKEYFKRLIEIDKIARKEVQKNSELIKHDAFNTRNNQFEKTRKKLKEILLQMMDSGDVDTERIIKVDEILNRVDLIPWDSNLKDIIENYENNKNNEDLIKGVEKIGSFIGTIKEEPKDDEIDYKNLKLIGAMFITLENNKSNIENFAN